MAKHKSKSKVAEIPMEVTEDRSMFNCPSCKGEGLVGDKLCIDCEGTGKFKMKSTFPDGTKVVTHDGHFIVKSGAMVKLEA